MSSAPLTVSFIGALQASLSVLLTLGYGLIAARYRLLKESSARDVSKLCVNMFLPMLIITNVGSQFDLHTIKKYYPVMLWSFGYTLLSILYGVIFVRFFKLPLWTAPACSFNNTTSLPLLLMQSLAVTGLLGPIAGGDVGEAVERSKSYFLINSMLSNGLTFALGPKLLSDESEGNETNERSLRRSRRGLFHSEDFSYEDIEDEQSNAEEGNGETSETTTLLPSTIQRPLSSTYDRVSRRMNAWFHKLPESVQKLLACLAATINAPLIGAGLALIVGIIPPLHKAMFKDMQEGGWMNAWFTSSLKNVGELFTVLQMFVVGTKLSTSINREIVEGENGETRVPKRCLVIIYLWRFVLIPIVAIGTIYMLAMKKHLPDDPVLWFSMMLMPCGPPAIILSSLAELQGNANTTLQVAKLLMISYAISPVICFTVVGALKASEAAAGTK